MTTKTYQEIINSSWTNLGTLGPTGVSYPTIALIGDYIYSFGGLQSSGDHNYPICKAPVSDPTSWSNTGKYLPGPLGYSHLFVFSDYIYLVGGGNWSFGSNVIYRASVSDPETWSSVGSLPSTVRAGRAAIIGDYAYIFGGWENYPDSSMTTRIMRAPLSNMASWSIVGNLPEILCYSSLAVIDNYIYIFGGANATDVVYKIYRASISDPLTWSDTGSTMPDVFTNEPVIIGNYIYNSCGSVNGGGKIYRAPISNPLSWSDMGNTMTNVNYGKAILINDKLYYFHAFTTADNNFDKSYSTTTSQLATKSDSGSYTVYQNEPATLTGSVATNLTPFQKIGMAPWLTSGMTRSYVTITESSSSPISIGGATLTKGTPTSASFDSGVLTSVITDSYFSNVSNWDKVIFQYQSSQNAKGYKQLVFTNNGSDSFANISALFSTHARTGSKILKKIMIVSYDGDVYEVKGSEVPGSDFTVE